MIDKLAQFIILSGHLFEKITVWKTTGCNFQTIPFQPFDVFHLLPDPIQWQPKIITWLRYDSFKPCFSLSGRWLSHWYNCIWFPAPRLFNSDRKFMPDIRKRANVIVISTMKNRLEWCSFLLFGWLNLHNVFFGWLNMPVYDTMIGEMQMEWLKRWFAGC